MKNLFKYATGALMTALMITACSPDEFEGADPNGLPTMEGKDFSISVDQEVNQVTLNFPETPGVYPIWIINNTVYSTLNNVGWTSNDAGTYPVVLKLGNRNGISQGSISKEFTFNETKVNWTSSFNRIKDKEWRIDNKEVAHMACGPLGGDGTGYWSAAADEKKGFGVYDDRISFSVENAKGGKYTYNPGNDGKTYVNKGTTLWGSGDADFDTPTQLQESGWHFERGKWTDADGKEVDVDYIVLDANSLFPYISADVQYSNPKFRIETLTGSKMVLIYDNLQDNISWRFILTSKAEEKGFEGFDANSNFNMWKNIDPVMTFYYNPDPSWANEQTAILQDGFVKGNNDYSFFIPSECYSDWQAQIHFHTNLALQESSHYDFSTIISTDKDVNGVIVKVTDENDADFIIEEHVDIKAGEEFICWKSDVPGKNLSDLKVVFDFGHAPSNTNVNIRNIVIKDHANDDGTVLPSDKPVEELTVDWDANASNNLWKAVEDGSAFDAFGYYFADGGWSPISFSEAVHTGDVYELVLPEGLGGSQWQGQFHIDTKLKASANKAYNFYLVMEADKDCPQVTIKLTDSGDDNYFFVERKDVSADNPLVFKQTGVKLAQGKDAETIRLFFDFGGCPAGTTVRISKIFFEEAVSMSYEDEDNLWKAVDDGSMFDAFGYYFADNGWSPISFAEAVHNGDSYELDLPEGLGGSQWQGQFHIDTKLKASANKQYHFALVMEADNDCPQVTIKLTDSGDDNYFFVERKDIPAGEPYLFMAKNVTLAQGKDAETIRLFFDFGGSPANTHVKISKIIFKEAS